MLLYATRFFVMCIHREVFVYYNHPIVKVIQEMQFEWFTFSEDDADDT